MNEELIRDLQERLGKLRARLERAGDYGGAEHAASAGTRLSLAASGLQDIDVVEAAIATARTVLQNYGMTDVDGGSRQ